MSKQNPVDSQGLGRLGMYLMLGSLATLFAGSLFGYLYIRIHATEWPPPGMPGFSDGLWINTLVLLGCSFFVHRALQAVRRDDANGLSRGLLVTFVLGSLFLGLQVLNYWALARESLTASANLYGFTFYMLTGLHFVHVVGGLIPLGIVLRNARHRRYAGDNYAPVEHVSMYWHFLDAVWVVIFVVLLLGS